MASLSSYSLTTIAPESNRPQLQASAAFHISQPQLASLYSAPIHPIEPMADRLDLRFGGRARKDVPFDEAEVQEYLERMRKFDETSRERFVILFENQMQNGVKHIAMALKYQYINKDQGIGWMNDLIRAAIKLRKTSEAGHTTLSSLGEAQLRYLGEQQDYLDSIGKPDLVDQYKAWKAARKSDDN